MSALSTTTPTHQSQKPTLSWREKLRAYIQLTRFDKPVGIELVFWSTLWAVMLASVEYKQLPPLRVFVIFAVGAVLMRAAGCAINDFADRKVDGAVARTQSRPLADGRLSGKEAVGTFVGLSLISGSLLFLLPMVAFYWACVAVVLAFIYPFMKRFTHLPQFFLAMAFGWAIPMAYVAVNIVLQPQLGVSYFPDIWCWLLFVGYMCWTVAYDTQYAMTDREDDLKVGIKSTAILFGNYDVTIIRLLQGAFLLCVAGVLGHYFGLISVLGLLPVIVMFYWQNKKCLTYQPALCFRAFLDNVWVGRYVFVLIAGLCWLKIYGIG